MTSTWGACGFLLLTMVAVSSGRNAADYFRESRFQYSPSRPEDALVLFIANAPPAICEPYKSNKIFGESYWESHFRLSLPRGKSYYTCSFEGNASTRYNLRLLEDIVAEGYEGDAIWVRWFREKEMYCTTNSQLPDEYFHLSVQRPHEDHLVKCHFLKDSGRFYLRFAGYPTIICEFGSRAAAYQFSLPGLDDPFRCAFRVYSELPLGDTQTERQLHQSLISRLPARVDGSRPRLVCSRQPASNATASFELEWDGGSTYYCSFPDAAPTCLPPTPNTPQD